MSHLNVEKNRIKKTSLVLFCCARLKLIGPICQQKRNVIVIEVKADRIQMPTKLSYLFIHHILQRDKLIIKLMKSIVVVDL